jgi:hypothetical protein
MDVEVLRTELLAAQKEIRMLDQRLTRTLATLEGGFEVVQVPGEGAWTPAMLAQLWAAVNHLPGVVALFELTSSRPNEVFTFTELLEYSKLDPQQQSNEHARLSRLSRQLFGQKTWPIQNWQGSDKADGTRGQMQYRMGGSVAAWWAHLVG